MNDSNNVLEIERITKNFGGLCAIKDVSFSFIEGEILGLIGPNGAGKSTLFNLIAGLYKPTSGRVFFKGEDITGLLPHKICWKGIARTFQTPQPFNGLTVLENILVGKIFGGEKRGSNRSVLDILHLLELEDKKDVLVENLTVVDQKKIEIGKALACDPEILLLDEVAAGLNRVEQESIKRLVLDINKNLKMTIVMIEHVMETIMNLSDRILVLNSGEILKVGLPSEIATDKSVIEAYLGKEFVARAES